MTGIMSVVAGSAQNIVYVSGLVRRLYSGYAGTNANWFDSRSPYNTSIDTPPQNQSWSDDDYSGLWLGYFRPTTTGVNTFTIQISGSRYDSYCYLWLGDTARSGYASNNALISSSGTASAGTSLVAGTNYPIRIQVGYEDDSGFFTSSDLNFVLVVNGSTSYQTFYNQLTVGF
jgi:hypothetical protein